MSAALVWSIDHPCPQCKARPGEPCRKPNGDRLISVFGTPAYHSARTPKAREGEADNG